MNIRPVDSVPPAKRGPRSRKAYDDLYGMCIEHPNQPFLVLERVAPHRAISVRDALRLRHEHQGGTGTVLTETRTVESGADPKGRDALVNVYVTFIPETKSYAE